MKIIVNYFLRISSKITLKGSISDASYCLFNFFNKGSPIFFMKNIALMQCPIVNKKGRDGKFMLNKVKNAEGCDGAGAPQAASIADGSANAGNPISPGNLFVSLK